MKKMKKSTLRTISKGLNAFVVLMMILQPVGMPSILRAMAASDPSAEAVSAPDQVPDPAPKEEPKTEPTAPVPDPAPKKEPAPVTDPKVEPTPAPKSDVTTPIPSDTPATDNTSSKSKGTTSPDAAATDKNTTEKNGQICLDSGAKITDSAKSDWDVNDKGDTAETKQKIELGVKYVFPGDENVSVTFSCLPAASADRTTLKIQQIASADINLPEGVSAASEFAYDITTTGMKDGDFKYDLTLPKSDVDGAEIKYMEKTAEEAVSADVTNAELKSVDEKDVKEEDKATKVSDLDHFTIFFTATLNGAQITVTPHEYNQGDTVHVKADGLTGYSNYYQLYLKPVSSAEFPIGSCDNGPFIGSNSRAASYVLPSDAETGTWTVELYRFSNSSCTNNKTSQQTPWPTFSVNENNSESTGNNAGTGSDISGVGSTTWLNPGNITTDDNNYATVSGNNQTHYLRGTNYGFNIPLNATINGVTVTIGRKGSTGSGSDVRDVVTKLVKNGTVIGDNKAATGTDWPSSEASAVYGSISDKWGTSWTPADINAANFGAVLSIDPNNRNASVDYMKIEVTYTITSLSNQTITVTSSAPASAEYGSTFPVSATASSSLPVAVTTTGGCLISSGIMTMTSGTTACVVHYNQAGNGSFNPAPEVTETATASKKAVTVTADSISKIVGEVDPALTYKVTSGSLVGADLFAGAFSRVAGETIGAYAINQNTLALDASNYTLDVVPGLFSINPDITPPAVTINRADGQADPTGSSPINFTATFSEPVNGFTASSVDLGGTANGTKVEDVTDDSGNGTIFSIAISGMSSSGTVIASISASAVQDASGNPNTASTSSNNSVTFNYDPDAFGKGMVTFSFDDGYKSAFNNIGSLGSFKSTHYIDTLDMLGATSYSPTYYSEYMTAANVQSLYNNGNEIGAHSRTHVDLSAITDPAQLQFETDGARLDLLSIGVKPVSGFAYPYGAAAALDKLKSAGFSGARTVDFIDAQGQLLYNTKSSDPYKLFAGQVNGDTPITPSDPDPAGFGSVEEWIDGAIASNKWLILVFHEIKTNCGSDNYCISPNDLSTIVSYIQNKKNAVSVVTVKDGLAEIGNQPSSDNTAPVITIPEADSANNINAAITSSAGAPVAFSSTVADSDAGLSAFCTIPTLVPVGDSGVSFPQVVTSGYTFPKGVTTVTCTSADTGGNLGTKTFTVTVTDAPIVALTTTSLSPTKDASIPVTATFNMPVTGFDASDIVVSSNASVSDFAGADAVYTFNIIPTADGTVTVDIPAGVAKGTVSSVDNTAAPQLSFVSDRTAPVITIVQPDNTPAKSKTITASVPDGTLTMSVDAGSVCDDTLTFASYADTTFSTEADNSKTICYKAEDSLSNISYLLSAAIAGIDTTAPTAPTNLLPDTGTPTGSIFQNWSWDPSTDSSGIADYIYRVTGGVSGTDIIISETSTGNATSVLTNLLEGVYNFFVKAVDTAGNQSLESFFTLVVDTTAPVIASHEDVTAEATSNAGATVAYVSPGTSDNYDPAGVATCSPVSGSTFALGNTTVTCTATDSKGNVATPTTFKVIVVDTENPIISLLGDNPLTIQVHSTYNEPGATVSDNYDIGLTATIDASAIDVDLVGSYIVKYDALDSSGNEADQKIRTVYVVDTAAPVVIITSGTDTIEVHTAFSDAGAVWTDNYDGSGIITAATSGSVDKDTIGDYILTYSYTDSNGNSGSADRIVHVVDTIAPSAPVASPAAGDYMTDQSVTLSSADDGSGLDKIYFTVDGSEPDNTKMEYVGAITVDKDMTIKAIAYDKVGNASGILTAMYGIAPVISAETSSSVSKTKATIMWTTDDPATSRVVYDTVSHSALGIAPNYDYANSTVEADVSPKVTSHSVSLTGLKEGTTYYYRVISHGSPESIGAEISFKTEKSSSNNGSGNGGGGGGSATTAGAATTGGAVSGASTGAVASSETTGGGEAATSGGETVAGDQTSSVGDQAVAGAEEKGQVLGEETQAPGFFGRHKTLSVILILIVLAIIYSIFFRKKKSDFPQLPQNPTGQVPPTV